MQRMNKSKEIRQTQKLLSYLSLRRRTQFKFILVLMVIGSLSEVASIGLVIPFLGVLTSPETIYQNLFFTPFIELLGINSPKELLLPVTIIFVVAVIFAGLIRLILLYVMIRFSHAAGHDLGINMYRKTLYQSYAFHSNQNSSELINGIIIKVNIITGSVIRPVLTIISSILLMLGIVTALMFVDVYTSLSAFLGFGLIYLGVVKATHKRVVHNGELIANLSTQMIKALQEGLGGIRDVIIDGTQNFFSSVYSKSDASLRRALGDNTFIAGSPRFIMEALGMTLIAILAFSLSASTDNFEYVIPTLGALALGAQRLLPIMQQLYDAYSALKGAQASLTDGLKLLERDLPNYIGNELTKPLNLNKDICLKDISFRYSDEAPWVLKNINLRFKKGAKVGFIGQTGSGKSTLLDILMGLIPPTNGKLVVDGELIDENNQHTWWKNISHVPQSIYLSDNTIKNNIAFGIDSDNIQLSSITHAAKLAQIDEMIKEWPKGYNTSIGERGIRLSGGQRQRIGIARALYKNASIIVFDEATSSLDTKTERAVMESIGNLNAALTIFIIAHRISTLKDCDVIHMLKNGEITKSMTYDELINSPDNS